jgi:hypothetical protein
MAQQSSTEDVHEESHGHSVAAWTLVGLVLVGVFVACLAMVLDIIWLIIVGLIIVAAGLVAGRLLAMAGFGVHPPAGPAPVE